MHLLRIESRSIDGTAEAVDLDQSPADIVALSFTDADLAVLAAAWEARKDALPSLRLANLAALRHPYSVDLYIEKVVTKARFVLVRLLGGMDYWRYGVDELAVLARSSGMHLAIVPGDHRQDARLDEASTLSPQTLRQIGSYFAEGGIENISKCLRFVAGHVTPQAVPAPASPVPAFGFFGAGMQPGAPDAPLALIVFYRSWMLAADTDPVMALGAGAGVAWLSCPSIYVTSLKDAAVCALHAGASGSGTTGHHPQSDGVFSPAGYGFVGAGRGGRTGVPIGAERHQPWANGPLRNAALGQPISQ